MKVCIPCDRLFLNVNRPGTRHCCDMAVCGNRAQVKRHDTRTRAAPR